ncbi:MAG: 3-keto-5-aminohexanoate cleavage protein [Roseibium sp.]
MKSADILPPLPLIMVAPNGALRSKADHPALPMTVSETVATAKACFEAGATGLHAHVRDESGTHVMDADLFRDLIPQMRTEVPGMQVQITTEAVGKYSPEEQRKLVKDVEPDAVSVALAEMVPDQHTKAAKEFYSWAFGKGIAVQHILYSVEDLKRFLDLVSVGVIPGRNHQVLFVLGRYSENQESTPSDLDPFLNVLADMNPDLEINWAACAFGRQETDCLVYAIQQGGKARIGFENNFWNQNGILAKDNAARVSDLVSALKVKDLYSN